MWKTMFSAAILCTTLSCSPSDSDNNTGEGNYNNTGGNVDVDSEVSADVNANEDGDTVVCPVCNDNLTWNSMAYNHVVLGPLSTAGELPDSYAWDMLDKCSGWSIHDGHEGGTGDTLEITSCNDGVILIWAYEYFMGMKFAQGWTGSTDSDICIGTSYEDFLKAYPGYDPDNSSLLKDGYADLMYPTGYAIFTDGTLSTLGAYGN